MTSKNGVLTSPSFPDGYESNQDCVYRVSSHAGTYIELSTVAFEVESPDSGVIYDYLEVRDGNSEESQVIGKFSGYSIPAQIHSSHNGIWLR